jgi:hypothetical protein
MSIRRPRAVGVTGGSLAYDSLASMTILGTLGFAHATRVSVERRCEYPCAYERSEACHWTGLYRLEAPLASIGEVVGALPGRLALQDYVSLESRHYVVQYGAKVQDVIGLVSAEPAGWRARFRGRAWAQIC